MKEQQALVTCATATEPMLSTTTPKTFEEIVSGLFDDLLNATPEARNALVCYLANSGLLVHDLNEHLKTRLEERPQLHEAQVLEVRPSTIDPGEPNMMAAEHKVFRASPEEREHQDKVNAEIKQQAEAKEKAWQRNLTNQTNTNAGLQRQMKALWRAFQTLSNAMHKMQLAQEPWITGLSDDHQLLLDKFDDLIKVLALKDEEI